MKTPLKKEKKKGKIFYLLLLKDHKQEHRYTAMEKSGSVGTDTEPNEVSTLPQHIITITTTNLNKNTEVVGGEFPNSVTVFGSYPK